MQCKKEKFVQEACKRDQTLCRSSKIDKEVRIIWVFTKLILHGKVKAVVC